METYREQLRLRLPRQLFAGKQKYLALELPDTDLNRKMAEAKAKLIGENPFAEMREDFRYNDSKQLEDIDSFSKEEMETVIAAFENHRHFKHYAPFVKFLFWTGARTSEAAWLKWKHITPDFQHITFTEAVVNVSFKNIRKCTKTKKARKFPLFSLPKLVELLQSINPADCDLEAPVFTSVTGELINSHSFNANV